MQKQIVRVQMSSSTTTNSIKSENEDLNNSEYPIFAERREMIYVLTNATNDTTRIINLFISNYDDHPNESKKEAEGTDSHE